MDDDKLRKAIVIGELLHTEIKKLTNNNPLESYALYTAAETIIEILQPVPAEITVELLRIIANSVELMQDNLNGDD